jgi:hypothetical protein
LNVTGMKKIAIPLVLALFAATACWPFSSDEQAEMSVERTSNSGRVQILRDSDTINVSDEEPLEIGDVVSTSQNALARVRLIGDERVSLSSETEIRIESTRAVEGPLHTGTIVADTNGSMRVDFSGVAATSTGGIFRIDKSLASVRAGAYTGTVKLETPGQPRVSLSKLFEVQAAASDLSAREPYHLDNSDPWDRVYLKSLVALDEDLTPLANGLRAQLGGSRPTLLYFRTLAKQDVGFMKHYLPRPTIDLLTAFVIANHAPGSMRDDFVRAFRLFDSGAEWAVAAGILDASFDSLVAELTDIAAASGAVAGGTGNTAVFSVASAQQVTEAGPGDTVLPPDQGSDPVPNPQPSDGGGGGGGKPHPTATPEDCGSSVECNVNDALDRVPKASPSPSGILDSVPKN